MTSYSLVAVALAAAVFASACSSSSIGGEATGATCPTDSTLTYDNFGKAFFESHCAQCHAGRESPTLSTVAAFRANKAAIDRVAASGPNATNTAMPEEGSVSTEDRQKLGQWLACGSP